MKPDFKHLDYFRFEQEWTQLINENSIDLTPPCNILELGTGLGSAAFWIVNNLCVHPQITLTTVDNFSAYPKQYATTVANLNCSQHPERVKVVKDNIQHFIFSNTVFYNFIYLDAAHNAKDVLWQMYFCDRWLSPGGALVVDDTHIKEVDLAVDKYKLDPNASLREVWYAGSQRAFVKDRDTDNN